MKRICIVLLAVLTISQICNAQINNPTVYVTENGSSTGTGVTAAWFYQPISADCFVYNVSNGVYSGDITVRFAGGDYYTDFVFDNIPNNVHSIKMYGGWNPLAPFNKRNLSDRDFYLYETRFHATGHNDLIRFNGVGYYHVNGAGTCIIDGITLTGDNDEYAAVSLYFGDHIISQCKFDNFYTTTWLVWMETASHTVTYSSCLFAENKAKFLMALCTHADLINVTIADNDLTDDMFLPFCSYNPYTQTYTTYYYYNLYNSIIYGNSNMQMNHDLTSWSHLGFFDVYNSILEDNEGWIVDRGNNLIGSVYDPLFNTYSAAPYSCDYYNSPAIGTGDAIFIFTSPFYDPNIMDYDVANMYRYFDFYALKVDRGAYQNGYDDGTHLYNVASPIVSAPQRYNHDNIEADCQTISGGVIQDGAILTLYDVSGKIIYTTSAANDLLNAHTLNTGIYIAVITSKEGQEIASKKIIIP